MSDWQTWFEQAWADREERLYPSLFGALGPGIYALDSDLFAKVFGQTQIDPRWLHYGVFESPPNARRDSWLYVSSGMSNAWEADAPDAASWSGIGCEFLLQTRSQSLWALTFVRKMVAYQILLGCGRYSGRPAMEMWDNIPLGGPIDGEQSALTWAMVTPAADDLAHVQQIRSGRFEFMQFVGITEREARFARQAGGDKLLALLIQHDAAPVVVAERREVPLS